MTEPVSPLATFYKPGWENYQQALIQIIAPLSSEQLALPLGPQQRSIGELLEHMIGATHNLIVDPMTEESNVKLLDERVEE